MTESSELAIDGSPQLQQSKPKIKYATLLKQFYQLAAPYWRSEEKFFAWAMLGTAFALNMGLIYIAVMLNDWNGEFFTALQNLDKSHFTELLLQFSGIVILYLSITVSEYFIKTYLGFRWRIWLTKQVMHDWLHNSTFYRLFISKTKTENPDQRISQDLNIFTANTLSLGFSIVTQLVKCVTFAVILWKLSSSIALPLPGDHSIVIPGYMLWLTIIYVTFCTIVIYKSGKPLVGLDYVQEKVEADFRFSLMRIRDRRDEVAMLNGSTAENKLLGNNIKEVIKNYKQIIKSNMYLITFQSFFLNVTTLLPILAASPMFFSGAITLGVLMQLSNAFSVVEGALMIFALNFQSFASWKATFNRIIDFRSEMTELATKLPSYNTDLEIHSSNDQRGLQINNLYLHLPETKNLTHFNFEIMPHERVLFMGRSGLGKSTLLKCIAGHWPYATGSINRPQDLKIIPQKPYFPISTLRNCLLYPNLETAIEDAELQRILRDCCLENLQYKLDEVHDWVAILSMGEQQRLNFARIIVAKPQWLILDEPTSAMDLNLEAKLFGILFKELPYITVLTIGHSLSLKELHTRCIEI